MEKKDLKKLLASLGIASLISAGGSMAIPGVSAASGWVGTKGGAGSAEKATEQPVDSTGKAVEDVKNTTEEVVDTAEEEAQKKAEEATDSAEQEIKKKAGDSGWSATK